MSGEEKQEPEPVPIIPPQWFADRMAASTGIYRGCLDPIVMMAWSFATEPPKSASE